MTDDTAPRTLRVFNVALVLAAFVVPAMFVVLIRDGGPYEVGVVLGAVLVPLVAAAVLSWVVSAAGAGATSSSATFTVVLCALLLLTFIGQMARSLEPGPSDKLTSDMAAFSAQMLEEDYAAHENPAEVQPDAHERFARAEEIFDAAAQDADGDERKVLRAGQAFVRELGDAAVAWQSSLERFTAEDVFDLTRLGTPGELQRQRQIILDFLEATREFREVLLGTVTIAEKHINRAAVPDKMRQDFMEGARGSFEKQEPYIRDLYDLWIEYVEKMIAILDNLEQSPEWYVDDVEGLITTDDAFQDALMSDLHALADLEERLLVAEKALLDVRATL